MAAALPPPDDIVVGAISIGPKNAELLTGQPWRWWRDHAAELGLQLVRIGGKSMIDALAVARVLKQQAAAQRVEPEFTVEQRTDRLLEELGYVPTPRSQWLPEELVSVGEAEPARGNARPLDDALHLAAVGCGRTP